MSKGKAYSLEEVKYIKECVKKYPTNLTQAFKVCAVGLDRPLGGIMNYYYRHIAPEKSNKCFFTISSKKTLGNYKVTRKGKRPTKAKASGTGKSKWKRILAILAE